MRRPNRHIEIFSMSVLDMFASALGAFIMIAVILFPSYMAKEKVQAKLTASEASRAALVKDLEQKGGELDEANNALAKAAILKAETDEEVEALRLEIARTFLIVSIEWDTADADVDLVITDPASNRYSFNKNNRNGTDFPVEAADGAAVPDGNWAELSFDNQTGPGIEVWQAPIAAPGEYVIEYVLYGSARLSDVTVPVNGKVFYRNGRTPLPVEELSNDSQRSKIVLRVTDEGTLEFP